MKSFTTTAFFLFVALSSIELVVCDGVMGAMHGAQQTQAKGLGVALALLVTLGGQQVAADPVTGVLSAVSSLAGIAEFIINITKGKESTAEDICEYVNWINADDVRQYVLELSCPNIMWVVHGRGIEADGSVSELWGPPAVQAVNGTILDNVRRHTRRFTTNQSDREVYEKALVSSMFKACCATANRGWMEECDDPDVKKTICRPWRENAVACDESFTCKAARDACVKVCTIITGEDGAQQPDETVDACHRSCEQFFGEDSTCEGQLRGVYDACEQAEHYRYWECSTDGFLSGPCTCQIANCAQLAFEPSLLP